jgi:hypothetical protein
MDLIGMIILPSVLPVRRLRGISMRNSLTTWVLRVPPGHFEARHGVWGLRLVGVAHFAISLPLVNMSSTSCQSLSPCPSWKHWQLLGFVFTCCSAMSILEVPGVFLDLRGSGASDSRWVPPVGGAPSRRTSTSRRCVRHQRCNDWVTKPSA